jgi:DNA (cytosine-5)-methyltransferase 1
MSRFSIPVLSLFCGCGAMDLGFRQQGFNPVLAIDISDAAIASYNWNRKKHVARRADLSSTTGDEIISLLRKSAPDVRPRGVIGGPPCQSFSLSNVHGKDDDPRRELPLRYGEILKALNKEFTLDFFVFENVGGLKSNKHKKYLTSFVTAFEDAGFSVFEGSLNASAFGVPQNRKRVFLVGINNEVYPNVVFEFPIGSEDRVTVSKAIRGLPEPAFFSRNIQLQDIPHHPNHWTMNPKSPKFSNGSNRIGRSFRRLAWDKPSWTVAYGHREIHVHPSGDRRVSIFEAMLLQGFPSKYRLLGNLTEQVEQVSNAVPPPLARALAEAIGNTLYDRVRSIQVKLLAWFGKNHRTFPWRQTQNPYRILIAEKLLQQTAATENVIIAYEQLLRSFPTVKSLSEASPAALKRIIGKLGFTYRAKELPQLARQILAAHKGRIPNDLDELLSLPGVGDYTARAIMSFAHGQDVPIVDTNIARLLYRVFGLKSPLPSNPARNKQLLAVASMLIPHQNSRNFNLAALDLCASICTPRQPKCDICPIRRQCDWNTKNRSNGNSVTARRNQEKNS